jgi:hypothetical protein
VGVCLGKGYRFEMNQLVGVMQGSFSSLVRRSRSLVDVYSSKPMTIVDILVERFAFNDSGTESSSKGVANAWLEVIHYQVDNQCMGLRYRAGP